MLSEKLQCALFVGHCYKYIQLRPSHHPPRTSMGFGQEKLHGKARQLTIGWIRKIIKAFLDVVGKVSQGWDEESVLSIIKASVKNGWLKHRWSSEKQHWPMDGGKVQWPRKPYSRHWQA